MRTATAEFSPTSDRKRFVEVRMRMAPDRFEPTNLDPSEKLCIFSAGQGPAEQNSVMALLKVSHQTNLKTELLFSEDTKPPPKAWC